MIAWYVKKGKSKVYYESFREALEDWKSHRGEFRYIWFLPMPKDLFDRIPEHKGW